MYLAIVSTTLDDIPILLTHDSELARRFLETLTESDLDAVYSVLGRDRASVCIGNIVRFNTHGAPIERCESVELPQLTADGN